MQHRRRVQPAFAVRWDAALVVAAASFDKLRTGGKGSGTRALTPLSSAESPSPARGEGLKPEPFRTCGGEVVTRRTRDGRWQVQRAQAGKLTRQAEQAFLAALSATANVSLSAAAVGADPHAFYRRRKKDPAFAREHRLALQRGYDAIELALMESSLPGAYEHDEWRSNDPPAMPPMTASQGLQLLYLHQKEARLTAEPDSLRRRRGETHEMACARLAIMAEERERLAREEFIVAEAERMERGEPPFGLAGEDVRAKLATGISIVDLSQVRGWSRADPAKARHDAERALFGGWRIEDMEAQQAEWWDDWRR